MCDFGEKSTPNLRGTHEMLSKFWKGFSLMCMTCYQVDCSKIIGFQASLEASRHTSERIHPNDLSIMVTFLESFSSEAVSRRPGMCPQSSHRCVQGVWGAASEAIVVNSVNVEQARTHPTSIPWTWGSSSTEAPWTWGTKTSWLGICSFCHAEKEAR